MKIFFVYADNDEWPEDRTTGIWLVYANNENEAIEIAIHKSGYYRNLRHNISCEQIKSLQYIGDNEEPCIIIYNVI